MSTTSVQGSTPPAAPRLPPAAAAPGGTDDATAERPANFADDLAQLLVTLSAPPEAEAEIDVPLPALAQESTDEAESGGDALAALWTELGLAGVAAPVAAPARPAGPVDAKLPALNVGLAGAAARAGTGPGPGPAVLQALALQVEAGAAAADGPASLAGEDTRAVLPAAPAAAPSVLAAGIEPARGLHSAPMPPAVVELRQPQAPQQIAESVAWHVGKQISEVHIRVNPEQLGPLEVQLKLDGDKVSMRFDMADASVRDVVQTSLPTLANLLAARGLQLDQAQVFSQDRGQPQNPSQPAPTAGGDAASDDPASAARVTVRRGLIDDYV